MISKSIKKIARMAHVNENAPTGMKEIALGPTGLAVAQNLARIREERALTYAALSKRLGDLHHPIPALGLRRIEARARNVSTDDLMALAYVLSVSPSELLLSDGVPVGTALPGDFTREEVEFWMRGEVPLEFDKLQAFWTRLRDQRAREIEEIAKRLASEGPMSEGIRSMYEYNSNVLSRDLDRANQRIAELEELTGKSIRVMGARRPLFDPDSPVQPRTSGDD